MKSSTESTVYYGRLSCRSAVTGTAATGISTRLPFVYPVRRRPTQTTTSPRSTGLWASFSPGRNRPTTLRHPVIQNLAQPERSLGLRTQKSTLDSLSYRTRPS
jgi:hypothetical protein